MPVFARLTALAGAILLTGCNVDYTDAATASDTSPTAAAAADDTSGPIAKPSPPAPTVVNDQATLERLLGNSGLTLQWVGWEKRGNLDARWDGNVLFLSGLQSDDKTDGKVRIDGAVVSVDKDSFIFDGTIEIDGTPDSSRHCLKQGKSIFAITQGRKYFRMREFEWCDGLTDYIDIYF